MLRWTTFLQNGYPTVGSDHVPIQLKVGNHFSSPIPFRYELVWASTDGFQELVQKWWMKSTQVGCRAFIFSKKISFLMGQLWYFAKYSFGSIKLKKLAFLHDMEELDTNKETRRLTPSEAMHEQEIQEQLSVIFKQEKIYWKQLSRL